MIKFTARFTWIGPMVSEFTSHGILVLFGEDAPAELKEFAVIHDGQPPVEPVAAGDNIQVGDREFRVLAVGEVANKNLAALGHLVLKCNGRETAEMPGDVCVEEKPLPPIEVGTTLVVSSQS